MFSMRIDRTVQIARRQAQVSEQALRSPEEGNVLLRMDEVVPAHLDGKPTSGAPQALPRSTPMRGGSLGPTGGSEHIATFVFYLFS
jgi:hypothetical protein